MSSSVTQTPCAASVLGPQKPIDSRYCDRRRAGARSRAVFTSSSVSARWIRSARCSVAPARAHASSVALSFVYMRVRRDRRDDQRSSLNALMKRFGARQPVGRRLRVGDRELDDRLAEHAAQPGVPRRLRDLLLEVIHVGDTSSSPTRSSRARRGACPIADELRRHGLGFRREDVLLQPVHQRQVVGEAAVHHHRRMRVRVDQAGQHDLIAARRSSAPRNSAPRSRPALSDVDDVGAVDRDGARRQHLVRCVRGDRPCRR